MRPKNVNGNRWVINRESYFPKKIDAIRNLKINKPTLPHTIENVGRTKTPFGTYRRDIWRLRTYLPNQYKGQRVQTTAMTRARAAEVSKFHPDKKLVKIKGAYFYI